MKFLEVFEELCYRKDVPPSRALEDAGLSKSLYQKWKAKPESIPNAETLLKLSKYFMVSTDVFITGNPFGVDLTGLEGYPEIEALVAAAPKLSAAARKNILLYAKFICPEAFL